MTALFLLIGIVLVVAALRGTQGTLVSNLSTDVPGFVIWGAAILAIAALGYLPGLKIPSRLLLALVVIVLVLNNYQAIMSGFSGLDKSASGSNSSNSGSAATASSQTLSVLNSLVSNASAAGVSTT